MAQVIRKLQGGGNTERKYGKIIVNGEVVNDIVDDDFISSKFGDDEVGSAIAEKLRNNEDVRIDTSVNGANHINIQVGGKNIKKQSRFLGGLEGSKKSGIRDLIDKYATYDYSKKEKPVDTYDFSRDLNIDYDINSVDLFSRTPAYTQAIDRLKEYLRLNKEGLNEGSYKWHANSGFKGGLNPSGNDVKSFISSNYDTIKRLVDSELMIHDDGDLELLKSLGININDKTKFDNVNTRSSNTQSIDDPNPESKAVYKELGLDGNNAVISSMNLVKNEDGSYTIDPEWLKNHPEFNRAHITNSWLTGRSEFEPLKGGFFYDGKYYPKTIAENPESVFHKNIIPFYRSANLSGTKNSLGIDQWGLGHNAFAKYDPSKGVIPGMYNIIKSKKNPWIAASESDIPGVYNYSIYDDNSKRDIWGIPEEVLSYVFNPKTGVYDEIPGWLNSYTAINGDDNSYYRARSEEYPGYYTVNIAGENGTEAQLYISETNPNEVYYKSQDMKRPAQLYQEELNEIFGGDFNTITGVPYNTKISRIIAGKAKDSSRDWIGRLLTLADTNRKVLGYQHGGVVLNQSNVGSKQETADVKYIGNTSKAAKMSEDFTTADKIQLAAIASDLTALLSSAVGGGNVVSGVTGLTGTVGNFAADVTRDGLDMGDIGNLALGVGLDLASVLPGVGSFASGYSVLRTVKRSYNVLKPVLIGAGMYDAVKALDSIRSGDPSLDNIQSLVNGLTAVVGAKKAFSNAKVSKFNPEVKSENIDVNKLRNDYIDKFVSNSKNSNATYHNGSRNKWFDEVTGKIKQGIDPETNKSYYDLAYEGLKGKKKSELNTDEDFSFDEASWIRKREAQIKNSAQKASNTLNRFNPFSEKFKWDDSNRTLGKKVDGKFTKADKEAIKEMIESNPNAVSRMMGENEDIAALVKEVDPEFADKSAIRRFLDKFKFKEGGVVKAKDGLSFGKNKGLSFDPTKTILSAIELANAYKSANKQEKLAIESANNSRFNIAVPKMEAPRFSNSDIYRSRDKALKDLYSYNIPLTSDAKLNSANMFMKASKAADINTATGTEDSKLQNQFNEIRSRANYANSSAQAQATNQMNEMDAKIRSAIPSIKAQYQGVRDSATNAALSQMKGDYENINKLNIQADVLRKTQEYNNDYIKKYNKLSQDLKQYMTANNISSAALENDTYYNNVYLPALNALQTNLNNQVAMSRNTWRNPITGMPIYYNPSLLNINSNRTAAGTGYVFKTGGRIRPYNKEALLENLKSRNKMLKDADDRVLKILLNLFK